jgi:hypothetical protein
LLEFDSLRSSVYLMSDCGLKAYTPSDHSTIPWPIIWLLARYHKKHRLLEGRVPPIKMHEITSRDLRTKSNGGGTFVTTHPMLLLEMHVSSF